jgi:hypothetical protein
MIDGKVVYLSKEQVSAIKNKWLVLNEDTIRRSTPNVIPRGSHYLKKKEVKSRRIENANKGIVLEIKIKPEYMSQFRAALDW